MTVLLLLLAGTVPTAAYGAQRWSRTAVIAREWSLTLSRSSVRPGTLIAELQNAGEDGHDLAIQRISKAPARVHRLAEQRPGSRAEIELNVSAGRYRLWCTLPGHRQRGMRTVLLVR
jgi:plastocyanin